MLSVIILGALVKLNMTIEKPHIPASIYAVISLIFGFLLGGHALAVLISAPINFGLSLLFFWLLKKAEGSGSWWAVLIIGILIFLGLSFFGAMLKT